MRFSWLIPLLAVASPILASAKNEESVSSEASSEPKATVFNGQEVPPLMQMSGEKLNDEIAKGYWYVNYGGHWEMVSCLDITNMFSISQAC
jgi:hypothetical protein